MIIEQLSLGKNVSYRPSGNSMTPLIYSGDLVTLTPCELNDVEIGDVVFCKVKGTILLHLCTAKKDGKILISNNHGHDNGWTSTVYGKMIRDTKPKKEKPKKVNTETEPNTLIYYNTIDNNTFSMRVDRLDPYTGLLKVIHISSESVIYTGKVSLMYGAFFGPDVADVHVWQEIALQEIDKYNSIT